MEVNLNSFDALDQIEILCAKLHHGSDGIDGILEQLQVRASKIPESALVSLRVCGIPVGF
jgi:hypothetical protein